MKKATKVIALFLSLVIMLSFAACGKGVVGENAEDSGYKGKTLTVAVQSLPDSLVIQTIKPTTGTREVIPALYGRLTGYNEDLVEVPNMCTSYEWLDETSLKIVLREGLVTATGIKVTAEDVAYSYTLGKGGVSGSFYNYITDVEVVDELTAIIKMDSPHPLFVEQLKSEAFSIVSKEGVEKDGGLEAAQMKPVNCTTGAYKFYEWKEGQYLTLQYNENYWDKDYVPSFEFIRYVPIPDNASRCLSVKSGDADMTGGLSLAEASSFTDDPVFKIATVPSGITTVLFFNCTEGIFTNEKLRQAIGYLIDWEQCAKIITGDNYIANEGTWSHATDYFYDSPVKKEYDPEKGKALMAEAGYPDGFDFEIVLAQPMVQHTNVAIVLQSQLEPYGINLKITTLDLGVYFGIADSGAYEAHIASSANSMDTQLAFFDDRYTRPQHFGGPQLSDPTITELCAKIRNEFDYATRKAYFDEIEKLYIEHRYGYSICDEIGYTLYNSEKISDMTHDSVSTPLMYIRPAGYTK